MTLTPPRRTRRPHSEAFKQSLIEACGEPGASVAGVALANGINANQLRRWSNGVDPLVVVIKGEQVGLDGAARFHRSRLGADSERCNFTKGGRGEVFRGARKFMKVDDVLLQGMSSQYR